jgi:small basic protein (TIGR04137 family)
MSIDRSLKIKGALTRHRNVLTRAERIEKLKEEEKWSEDNSVLGLPKVIHRKSHAGKKIKEALAKEAATEAVAGAVTEAAAATAPKTAVAEPKPKPKGKTKES